VVNPQFWWFMARAGGLVAWGLLTTTMVWGVLLHTRLVPKAPPAALLEMHRFLGWLAASFVVVHVIGLLSDRYVPFGITDILVPLAASWRPGPVALGVIACYLLGAVLLTSMLMRRMSRRWWHRVHLLNFPLFWVTTAHALLAGSDAHTSAMILAVYVLIGTVLLLTLVRVLSPRRAAPPPPRGFHRLTVEQIRQETPDAVSVAFQVPRRLADSFRFSPGQYLTLRTRIDGVEVRRPYSICSGVYDGELRIAVKLAPQGRMSTWIHTELRRGDKIDVLTPSGRFTTDLTPRGGRTMLAVAAGSGITPILSIITSVLAGEPHSRCTLLYGNRTAEDVLFARRLWYLQRRYRTRFRVLHILSRQPQERAALHGRISAGVIRSLAGPLTLDRIDEAFLCGPAPMTEDVRAELIRHGLAAESVHSELFSQTTDGMTVVYGGTTTTVPVEPGDTILDSGLRAGLDLPYSCRSGICGTCRAATAIDGAGTRVVLACQAQPTSSSVVVDFDAV
jgi:ferredoxin-NADP reductase/DMSO/TMAO reductase YedYZ heme-binding membrane subunit